MNFFKKLVLVSLILLIVSCNFVENINVNPDGTGDFSVEVDGSGLMAMAGDKMGEKLGSKNKKSIDSTFSFKQLFEQKKDSIAKLSAEEQAALKKMENFVMHMKMNAETKELLFSMNTPFKKVSELQDMMSGMKTLNDLNQKSKKQTPNPFSNGFNNNSKLNFSYNGKNFTRTAIIDKEALNKIKKDSTGMAKMIFGSSKYTLKYHFPKPVKTVSNPDALFSADRKTITIQYPFTDYMDNPEKMNLTIAFD
ncbi:hypothetical protein [Flavobacterium sp. UMI-01]|uniref:hypothetical protein n=1 Tax=Flavobacterium sp. UMI-01 TaxID=1441053 RepID=UPI001C7CCF74|nr:hypothetical protein [Flavobacterium sp. UMI-01]GIZ08844.1 hypothetical protein FUMI01_15710 [Flavobacterium sp. UMI-01]